MTEPRTVWAVTSGEYSDYRVLALFEREQDATEARAAGLGDGMESFSCFPTGHAPVKVAYWKAYRGVTANGSPETQRPSPNVWSAEGKPTERWTIDGWTAPTEPRVTVERQIASYGWSVWAEAMTQEDVAQAINDAVAKLRAEILEREQAKPKPGQKPDRRRPR